LSLKARLDNALHSNWHLPCLGHQLPDKDFYTNDRVQRSVEFSEVDFCRGFYLTKIGFCIVRRVAILMIMAVDLWKEKMSDTNVLYKVAEIVTTLHCHPLFRSCPTFVPPWWAIRMLRDFITSLAPWMKGMLISDPNAFSIGITPFPYEHACKKAMTWGPLAKKDERSVRLADMQIDIDLFDIDNEGFIMTTRVPLAILKLKNTTAQSAVAKSLQPYLPYDYEKLKKVIQDRFTNSLDKNLKWKLIYLNPQWGNEGVAVDSDTTLWVAMHDMREEGVKLFMMRVSKTHARI